MLHLQLNTKILLILTIVSIFLVLSAIHQVEAVPPASTQDLYDWHDVILLGKVISKNSTFSPTHFSYEIKVEKYLKNPQPYDIISAAGLNRLNPNLANTVFEVGDRGLFFLNNYTQKYDSNNPYTISIRSIKAQPEWDLCNLFDKEIPREHWVFGPGSVSPKVSQGNETNIDNFLTNKEILISYDFLNHTPETKYFEFGASITQWDDSTRPVVFRESRAFSLEPCTVYKTITLSFVPTNAGHYSFELYDPLGTRFGIGFVVHDESSSEFDYPVPGSGIIADTLPIKKQFKLGLGVNELKCKDELQLVFKSNNATPACVKPETKTKLIERGWAVMKNISGLVNPETYLITEDNKTFQILYSLKGANLSEIVNDDISESVHVRLENATRGELIISIPRDLIDAKIGGSEADDVFFVLIDGEEYPYTEKAGKTERTLTILFPRGAQDIEIIGTNWI